MQCLTCRQKQLEFPAERGSGHINILGAAAQLIKTGDLVIVMAFGLCTREEALTLKPNVVVLGEDNEVLEKPGT